MNILPKDTPVKQTVTIFVCWYDYRARWFFVEQHKDGTLKESKFNYPSEFLCEYMIDGLQTDLGCAPDATVRSGGYRLPHDWKHRTFHPSCR